MVMIDVVTNATLVADDIDVEKIVVDNENDVVEVIVVLHRLKMKYTHCRCSTKYFRGAQAMI